MHDAHFCHLPFPSCCAQWGELNSYFVQFYSKVVEIGTWKLGFKKNMAKALFFQLMDKK